MRAIFNQELKQLGSDLESMANQVATAIERAAESLRQGDIVIAEQVIDADERINDLQRDIDDLCVMLLARQQPVAGDLRNVLSALRMAQTLERQGDLARLASPGQGLELGQGLKTHFKRHIQRIQHGQDAQAVQAPVGARLGQAILQQIGRSTRLNSSH